MQDQAYLEALYAGKECEMEKPKASERVELETSSNELRKSLHGHRFERWYEVMGYY